MINKPSGNSLERTVIDTNSVEYECRGRTITLEIDIVRTTEGPVPKIDLDGQVWIDGELVSEARIPNAGEWMVHPQLPKNHPLLKNSEPTGGNEVRVGNSETSTVGQQPANVLDIPNEFYDSVFQSYQDAERTVNGEVQTLFDKINCEIELHGKVVDTQTRTLHAEATVITNIGKYRFHFKMQSDGVAHFEVYRPESIPDQHADSVYAAALLLTPISYDTFVDEVIISNTDKEQSLCDSDEFKPICQASSCTKLAEIKIPSPDGHPDEEWKLCDEHAEDTDYQDPYRNTQTEWTLKKLYYLNADGERVSHNLL